MIRVGKPNDCFVCVQCDWQEYVEVDELLLLHAHVANSYILHMQPYKIPVHYKEIVLH